MKTATLFCLVMLLTVAGCSKRSTANDPVFARKVIDSVYSGSLAGIKDSLSPEFDQDDDWAQEMSNKVKPEFGAIKDVKLNTFGQTTQTTKEVIWKVTTETSELLMQLVWDKKSDKLLSIQLNY